MSKTGNNGHSGTAQRALDVAERLLQVRGYNGFSYGDVAAEVGISRAALHYHFPDKAEMGEALIQRYADRFTAALVELDAAAPDAATKLTGYTDLYTGVLQRDRMCLCAMLAAEYHTLPAGMQHRVSDFFEHNNTWLRTVLEQGIRDGSLTFSGTADDVANMLLGALEGALLIRRMDSDVKRFRATVAQLLANLSPDCTVL